MNSRLFAIAMVASSLWAHDPVTTKLTWTQEISRIVNRRCVACHAEFRSYETARPWAKAIRDEVTSRRMPPWGAAPGIGEFAGDPSLSGPEIDMLVSWVEGGAPEGNPIYLETIPSVASRAVALPRYSRAVAVEHEFRLTSAGRVVALKPSRISGGASLEAWAALPDGTVERLIWFRAARTASARTFVFRDPSLLPAGTRLRVQADSRAAMTFYLK